MSYEIYRYIFIVALILCGVFLAVSVALFFVLNIPKIIRDLSGMTAKKAIREIREQNEKTGDKSYKVSQVNRDRGKLTDKISPSGRIVKQTTGQMGYAVETAKIAAAETTSPAAETSLLSEDGTTMSLNNGGETSVLSDGYETMPLQGAGETSVLSDGYETMPLQGAGETSVLSEVAAPVQNAGETSVLDGGAEMPAAYDETSVLSEAIAAQPAAYNPAFAVEFDITLIHTNEVITAGAGR